MNIRPIKKPKTVTLIGNIDNMQDSKKKIDLSNFTIIDESLLEYQDLVFTLRNNPTKYSRPIAIYEQKGIRIVGNNLYYGAAKEAGLKTIKIDLINPNLPLDEIMLEENLQFPEPPIQREYMERFLFFINPPNDYGPIKSNIVINRSEHFQGNHCVSYKVLLGSPDEVRNTEDSYVKNLVSSNGPLRSIDGEKSKDWRLGRFIS